MEQLFGIEPYKSLRDRCNVYSVKVVSKANFISALNEDNAKCFEYASKVPGINTDKLMVTVVYNTSYDSGRSYTNWGANVDWRNDPTTVRWSRFLQDDRYGNEGLGLYEGANLYGFGAYRPTENSMMRYNDSLFNAPSREQIYKTVMQMSEGSSWTYDYEDFVEFDAVSLNAATTRSLRQAPSAAQVEKWKKSHRPPVRMKGTWRDARKKSITVPYR